MGLIYNVTHVLYISRWSARAIFAVTSNISSVNLCRAWC